MNRDSTIVQVAMLLIVIAIVGVAVLKQNKKTHQKPIQQYIAPIQESGNFENTFSTGKNNKDTKVQEVVDDTKHIPIEKTSSVYKNITKQYFAAIAKKDYLSACNIVAGGKCNTSRKSSIENFSKEFKKMTNSYEYVNIKDYGFISPSGKHIVCVKYNYRYKGDTKPGLVSEIMSFYIEKIGGKLKIANRVCEKKYKEGVGLRDCPIKSSKNFCVGLVK